MKHKLQTMLKHKLQWLLLLAALLGVSQGVWGDNTVVSDGTYRLYFQFSGGSTWWNNSGCYHYAWVWNSGNSGQYARIYKVGTTNSESTGNTSDVFYMVLPAASNKAINRMILFRGKSSSNPANGSTTWVENHYNKTGDVVISNNISTYNLVTAVTENGTSCTQTSNYAVAPSSCSVSVTGYTSGSGTSADPYVVSVGDSYTLTLSATCDDGNLKKYYTFDDANYSTTDTKSVTATVAGTTTYENMYSKTLAGYSTYSSEVQSSPDKIYVQAVAACTQPTKSQYTMASQSTEYTSSAITPSITVDDGAGSIKNYYYSTDGSTWTSGKPTDAGAYYIKIDVNAGDTYCAKDGIVLDNQLTITQASRTITVDENSDVKCGAGTYTITSTASVGSGTKTYSITSGSSIASINSSTGVVTLSGAGTFTVKVVIAASGNYASANGSRDFTVTLPTVGTTSASSITLTGATLTGSVTSVTCAPSESGFEYKKGSDSYTKAAAASTTGTITTTLENLLPGTTYTYRTYTTVNGVDKYGDEKTFPTTACTAPEISSSSLDAQSKCKDASGTAMSVTATGGVTSYTYQWYSNTTASTSGGSSISDTNSASYTPSTGTVGTKYYYCVVSSAAPCASSKVTSDVSGAVEILQKPTLTATPSTNATRYPYLPITFTSDMDADTSLENKGWGSTNNESTSYFVSKNVRTAVYKRGSTTSARVWVIATNGCKSSEFFFTQTADTETCPED